MRMVWPLAEGYAARAVHHERLLLVEAQEETLMTAPADLDRFVTAMTDLVRGLLDDGLDDGPDRVYRSAVAGVLRAVPHAAAASVSLLDKQGHLSSTAPSDPSLVAVDHEQGALGEGPCLDAARTRAGECGVARADDLAVTSPWPRWAPTSVAAGFGSVLSLHLGTRHLGGSLNLYGRAPGSFTAEDERAGMLVAGTVAVAVEGARRASGLAEALESRDMIGRAKGILAERFAVSDEAAFAMLVESSQTTNLKLRDVARWLTGEAESRAAAAGVPAGRQVPEPRGAS